MFHECELLFELSSTGDLHPLKSAALLDARLPLRQDLLKLRLAGYMAQLMMATVEAGEQDAEWHRLIAGALDYTIIKGNTDALTQVTWKGETKTLRKGERSDKMPQQE